MKILRLNLMETIFALKLTVMDGKIDSKHGHQFQFWSQMHGISKRKVQHYSPWQESNCNHEILVQAVRCRHQLVLI